jgi:ferritin-like metal-binding protein YciE
MPELQEILVEELRDLYDAEKQLVRALPKMARAATYQQLKQAFTDHTQMTQNQVARIEQVFELLGERAKSKPCKAMKGLVEEGQEQISEHEKGPMLDAMLIGAAQKVEHYEISGYGTARTLAKAIGQREVADLLDQTAKEEGQTDKLLTQISLQMLKEVARAKPEDLDEEQPNGRSGGRSARGGSSRGGGAKKKVATSRGAGGASARSGGGRSSGSGRSGSRGGSARNGRGGGAQPLTDHEEIRRWAEERGATPTCVRGTGGKGDVGMIRLDFPGFSGEGKLEPISWDDWFRSFDENSLALLVQERTAGGQQSNFNKLVSRESAEQGPPPRWQRGGGAKAKRR